MTDMRKDFMQRMDQLNTQASYRDINQDLIALTAMSNVFIRTPSYLSLQFICGVSIERCNMAFINACQKSYDYIDSLVVSSKNLTLADETAA